MCAFVKMFASLLFVATTASVVVLSFAFVFGSIADVAGQLSLGHLEVDDGLHVVDVYASSHDVGCHEDGYIATLEAEQSIR